MNTAKKCEKCKGTGRIITDILQGSTSKCPICTPVLFEAAKITEEMLKAADFESQAREDIKIATGMKILKSLSSEERALYDQMFRPRGIKRDYFP